MSDACAVRDLPGKSFGEDRRGHNSPLNALSKILGINTDNFSPPADCSSRSALTSSILVLLWMPHQKVYLESGRLAASIQQVTCACQDETESDYNKQYHKKWIVAHEVEGNKADTEE
jgi:hypothetical protein